MKRSKIVFTLILLVFSTIVLAFVASVGPSVVDRKVSFGYKLANPPRTIDAIIIHSTYNASGRDSFNVDSCIKQFQTYQVSAHYIIDRLGVIYRLVDEKDISFHAGKSSLPDGRTKVNDCSIGIEIITTKKSSPTEAQYKSLVGLVKDIKSRYSIKYIQGHEQIAPGRKTDPWNFDWGKFNSMIQ